MHSGVSGIIGDLLDPSIAQQTRGLFFVDAFLNCSAGRWAVTVASPLPGWITGTSYFGGNNKHGGRGRDLYVLMHSGVSG